MGKSAYITFGCLFLILFWTPLQWLYRSLYATEYRLHSALLVGFLVFIALKYYREGLRIRRFEIRLVPFLIFSGGIAGFLGTEKLLDIDVISCLFLGLTLYGFAGNVIDEKKWRNASVLVLLFFVCLPLSYHIETFLGFPLRVFSAKAAQVVLQLTGHQVQSTETILVVENKLANVDLPCSGMKSLWSLSLFVFVLSLIEKYKVNLNWVLSYSFSLSLVVAANIFRILMLVLTYKSNLPDAVKDSLHVPLGLIGFLVACLATGGIFKGRCQRGPSDTGEAGYFCRKSLVTIAAILLLAILIDQFAAKPAQAEPRAQSRTSGLPLTAKESDLFLRHGVLKYDKKKFAIAGLQGTAFLVVAKSWRGHHHPEQCLAGQGGAVEATKSVMIEDGFSVRRIGIKNSEREVVYWFQSLTSTTEDYSSRVWSGLAHPQKRYAMISLYIDNGKTADVSAFKNLINNFHHQALVMLQDGGNHETEL